MSSFVWKRDQRDWNATHYLTDEIVIADSEFSFEIGEEILRIEVREWPAFFALMQRIHDNLVAEHQSP